MDVDEVFQEEQVVVQTVQMTGLYGSPTHAAALGLIPASQSAAPLVTGKYHRHHHHHHQQQQQQMQYQSCNQFVGSGFLFV